MRRDIIQVYKKFQKIKKLRTNLRQQILILTEIEKFFSL